LQVSFIVIRFLRFRQWGLVHSLARCCLEAAAIELHCEVGRRRPDLGVAGACEICKPFFIFCSIWKTSIRPDRRCRAYGFTPRRADRGPVSPWQMEARLVSVVLASPFLTASMTPVQFWFGEEHLCVLRTSAIDHRLRNLGVHPSKISASRGLPY
jgi:hypothetical protein